MKKAVTKLRVLLIDDVRDMGGVPTKIARTYNDGIEALEKEGPWDLLLLDHDLSSYDPSGREMTGYDVMCWLERNPQFLPSEIQLVTASPVGRQRMQVVVDKLYGRRNG